MLLSLQGLAVDAVTVLVLVAGGALGGLAFVLGEVHRVCGDISIFKK